MDWKRSLLQENSSMLWEVHKGWPAIPVCLSLSWCLRWRSCMLGNPSVSSKRRWLVITVQRPSHSQEALLQGKNLPSVPVKSFVKQLCTCKSAQNFFSIGEGLVGLFGLRALSWVSKVLTCWALDFTFCPSETKSSSWNHCSPCIWPEKEPGSLCPASSCPGRQPPPSSIAPSCCSAHSSQRGFTFCPSLMSSLCLWLVEDLEYPLFPNPSHPLGKQGWERRKGRKATVFLFPISHLQPRSLSFKTKSYLDINDYAEWSLKRTKGFRNALDISPWILEMADLEVLAQGASFFVTIKIIFNNNVF